jgi:hypothetical protein
MTDAEEQFADRLAEDIERVLGVGILVDDVRIERGEGRRGARVTATLMVGSRIETIEAAGTSVLALYRPILQRAAELRLREAYWQLIGPT